MEQFAMTKLEPRVKASPGMHKDLTYSRFTTGFTELEQGLVIVLLPRTVMLPGIQTFVVYEVDVGLEHGDHELVLIRFTLTPELDPVHATEQKDAGFGAGAQ